MGRLWKRLRSHAPESFLPTEILSAPQHPGALRYSKCFDHMGWVASEPGTRTPSPNFVPTTSNDGPETLGGTHWVPEDAGPAPATLRPWT